MNANRAMKVETLARKFIELVETLPEFRAARDRLGDRAGERHRRETVSALMNLLREALLAERER